jgi:hypothetical protein
MEINKSKFSENVSSRKKNFLDFKKDTRIFQFIKNKLVKMFYNYYIFFSSQTLIINSNYFFIQSKILSNVNSKYINKNFDIFKMIIVYCRM